MNLVAKDGAAAVSPKVLKYLEKSGNKSGSCFVSSIAFP